MLDRSPPRLRSCPRIPFRGRERRPRRLGAVVHVEASAGVAEGAQNRHGIHDSQRVIGLQARVRRFVGGELAPQHRRLRAELRRNGRGVGDPLERRPRVVVGPPIGELDDHRHRGERGVRASAARVRATASSIMASGVASVQRGAAAAGAGYAGAASRAEKQTARKTSAERGRIRGFPTLQRSSRAHRVRFGVADVRTTFEGLPSSFAGGSRVIQHALSGSVRRDRHHRAALRAVVESPQLVSETTIRCLAALGIDRAIGIPRRWQGVGGGCTSKKTGWFTVRIQLRLDPDGRAVRGGQSDPIPRVMAARAGIAHPAELNAGGQAYAGKELARNHRVLKANSLLTLERSIGQEDRPTRCGRM